MPKIVKQRDKRELEARRQKVLTLYCKGKTLEEIAKELGGRAVSTISDDLKAIRQDMIRRNDDLANAVLEEIALSIVGLNEGLRNLWQIIDGKETTTTEKMRAIYLLACLYKSKAEFLDSQHMIDTVAPRQERYGS